MPEIIVCNPPPLDSAKAGESLRMAAEMNPLNRLPDLISAAMVDDVQRAAVSNKYWGADGVDLSVSFLDNPPQELRTKILFHMNAWDTTAGGNVKFKESSNIDGADVRINREVMADKRWRGYWSFLGTDIKVYSGPANQTMNLEAFSTSTSDAEFHRVVRHEAGHTIGLVHEHMREELVNKIDPDKAIAYYMDLTGWTEDQVRRQVLTPHDPNSIVGTPIADPDSIMAYHVPAEITKDNVAIAGGGDLSPADIAFIKIVYPK